MKNYTKDEGCVRCGKELKPSTASSEVNPFLCQDCIVAVKIERTQLAARIFNVTGTKQKGVVCT